VTVDISASRKVSGRTLLLCCALLMLAEVLVYRTSMNGYFFGDSLVQIDQRPRTFGQALRSFTEVYMWYRPLTQRACHYLLFPIFGLNFTPYHLLALALHMAVSFLLFFFLLHLLKDPWSALVGSLFLGAHSIGFYISYDAAFFAESILALCYLGAAFAFLSQRYGLTVLLFIVGLTAKETMVTLPAVLVIAGLLFKGPRRRQMACVGIILVILAMYTAFYARYMSVQGAQLVSSQRADYGMTLAPSVVLDNAANYLSWGFQIPRSWSTAHWVGATNNLWLNGILGGIVMAIALWQVIRADRVAVLGLLWIAITIFPTVLLVRCFVHHIYVPLVGVSILMGVAYAACRQILPRSLVAVFFTLLLLNHVDIAYRNVRSDNQLSWVGFPAQIAKKAARSFADIQDGLKPSAKILVMNVNSPSIGFALGGDALAKLVTGRQDVSVTLVEDRTTTAEALDFDVVFDFDGKDFFLRKHP
jgi:hypothetical protein